MADKKTETSPKEKFADLARDLMNIEVNIILNEDIPVQKMPSPRHALIDIGKRYDDTLDRMNKYDPPNAIDPTGGPGGTDEFPWEVADRYGGFIAFDAIRTSAKQKIGFLESKLDLSVDEKTDLAILNRMKDNADQIKGILTAVCMREMPELEAMKDEELKTPNDIIAQIPANRSTERRNCTNEYSRTQLLYKKEIPPLQLNPDELVAIRKIWEVGIEIVAMQTIIQLDGDVVTRVHPNYLADKYNRLHEYHNQGVGIALTYWNELIKVARDMVSALSGAFTQQTSRFRRNSS